MIKLILITFTSLIFVTGCSSKPKSAEQKDAKTAEVAKANKVAANKTTPASADSVVCKSGSDIRTLDIQAEGGGCQLVYTKFNESKNVASAASGTEYCSTVQKRIQTKLMDAGYKCE